MIPRHDRLDQAHMIIRVFCGALLVLMCSLCAVLFFAPGAAVTLADSSEANVHERQITPIIVNSPYLMAPIALQHAKVTNIGVASATLRLWLGPGDTDTIDPLEVTRARIGIEYVDWWENKKLAQMYSIVSAGPTRTGAVEATPYIRLQDIPRDMDYIIVWIEDMDISGKEYLPTKKIDMHDCGLAVLEERWRLVSFFWMKGTDELVNEVTSVIRK